MTMGRFPTQWSGADFLGQAGANEIVRRLKKYWAERGCEIHTWFVVLDTKNSAREQVYCVRSDMKNGWPPNFKQTTNNAARATGE